MKAEFLLLLIPLGMLVLWALWYRGTNWFYYKRYNPENDRGRKAEDVRRGLIERDKEVRNYPRLPSGPTSFGEERRPLATTGFSNVGQGGTSTGKTSPRPRNIFERFRRR